MKKVHLFIKESGSVTPSTLCYRLMIGKSERDQKQLSWLIDYSQVNNCYFRPWDRETDKFYSRLKDSIEEEGTLLCCVMDISELKRLIVSNNLEVFASKFITSVRSASNFLCEHDAFSIARFRANTAASLSTSTLPTVHVKNLKLSAL